MRIHAIVSVVLLAACGCAKKKTEATAGSGSGSGSAPEPVAVATGSGSGSETGSGSGSGSAAPTGDVVEVKDGLTTPESVLYDGDGDVYLVSNINGDALGADDNGYISKVGPDGKVIEAKWIDGAKPDVKLDAPKGMALIDGVLWVADITNVRRFDAKSGKQQPDVKVAGAAFLNDIAADGKGGIFVSDTGVDAKFAPIGKDAIYHVDKGGKVTKLIASKDLGAPNGVALAGDGAVWVVTFASGEIYQVDAKGKKGAAEKLPKGQLDGVVVLDNGDLLVSSWEGQAVYRGKPGAGWKEAISGVQSPADIGWDSKRSRVLIPLFQGNAIQARALP
jgi:sugar lactone lactonase YvrE